MEKQDAMNILSSEIYGCEDCKIGTKNPKTCDVDCEKRAMVEMAIATIVYGKVSDRYEC